MERPTVGCARCKGGLHIRVNGRWQRCPCAVAFIAHQFIKPVLQIETPLPPALAAVPPWPLRDLFFADLPWEEFQHLTSRFLAAYANERFTYEVFDEVRLSAINFKEDPGPWKGLRELVEYDLVILHMGRRSGVPAHPYHGAAVEMVLSWRQDERKPTWVYIAHHTKVHTALGTEVFNRLKPIRKSWVVDR